MNQLRVIATRVLYSVAEEGQSLATLIPKHSQNVAENDHGLLNELAFGTCRWFQYLESELAKLLQKPIKRKDRIARYLLIVGLYQLRFMRVPAHAAINETVSAAEALEVKHLTGLINAILRNYARSFSSVDSERPECKSQKEGHREIDSPTHASHPQWIIDKLAGNWPDHYQAILAANNVKAPLTLRVNSLKTSRDDFLQLLEKHEISAIKTEYAPHGVTLETPRDVTSLPGYKEGLFSVQDEAAQLCTTLLDLAPGQSVLDACAAPGGKTTAIIEAGKGQVAVTALDSDERRLVRVHENLNRLQQQANVLCGDARQPECLGEGALFDRLLIDAPCSATGVIRRHPDIKLLRKETDIAPLANVQLSILQALWPRLKPGGRLLYATCSVFPQENTRIIERFIKMQDNAVDITIETSWGIPCLYGRQLLPKIGGHDGFYYACIQKQDRQN